MKSAVTHFIIAVVISIAVVAGYASWYAIVSQKSKDVADLQSQIASASENMSRIASARDALAEIANDEQQIQNYFVSEASIVSVIDELEATGIAQGATVSVGSVSKGGSRTLPIILLTLSIEGTFDAVMRTVGAIEYAPYAISVSKLGVTHGEGGTWNAGLNITVDSAPMATATSTQL